MNVDRSLAFEEWLTLTLDHYSVCGQELRPAQSKACDSPDSAKFSYCIELWFQVSAVSADEWLIFCDKEIIAKVK